jgi:hypothetical protein
MNVSALFRTPPPAHAFMAGPEFLVYGRLDGPRATLEKVEREVVPDGWYTLGPVGVLQVERQPLADALGRLRGRLERPPQRASLVVPNSWVRSVVLDVGPLPRQRDEAEESLRWRLKKLLPCRPEDVRLDFIPVGDNGRVLVILALDRPLAAVEDAFATTGAQLVRIEPTVLALAPLVPVRSAVLVTAESRAFGIVVLLDGKVRWLRQKALPEDESQAGLFVIRELERTLSQVREALATAGQLPLWLAAQAQVRGAVEGWARERELTINELAGPSGSAGAAGLALLGTASSGEAV